MNLDILIAIGSMVVGLYCILKGSEWVTDAAVPLARKFNTTNVAMGLVLVSVLLSLPELVVAISSISQGHADIGIGTSIGSIIVNLGLIMGLAAIIHPLRVPEHLIARDAVFMFVATAIVGYFALGTLGVTSNDGVLLIFLFIPYIINVYEQEKHLAKREKHKESKMIEKSLTLFGKIGSPELVIHDGRVIMILGAILLIIGGQLFTNALISVSAMAGISGLLIGITVGAIGPSIPNLASVYQASKKGYDELAVSQTIGANIFTLLVTVGTIAILHPITLDPITASITAPALLITTVVFFFFAISGRITKNAGVVLVLMYLFTTFAEFIYRIH